MIIPYVCGSQLEGGSKNALREYFKIMPVSTEK